LLRDQMSCHAMLRRGWESPRVCKKSLRVLAVDELDCSDGSFSPLTRFTPSPGCGQILTRQAARPSTFGKTRPNILPDQGIFAIVVPEWTDHGGGLTHRKIKREKDASGDRQPYRRACCRPFGNRKTTRHLKPRRPRDSSNTVISWGSLSG